MSSVYEIITERIVKQLDKGIIPWRKPWIGSKEELIAELGAAFLINASGIDSESAFGNSVAYIRSWSKKLKEDSRLFSIAAAKAEAAVNFILGVSKDETKE